MAKASKKGKRIMDAVLTPEQCRGARGILDWGQEKLAEKARVSRPTIVDFERGARTPMLQNIEALRRAFEAAGLLIVSQEHQLKGVLYRLVEPTDDGEAGDAGK